MSLTGLIRTGLAMVLLGLAPLVSAGTAARAEPTAAGTSDRKTASHSQYRPPVDGPVVVVTRFDPLAGVYGAGHRGVDLGLPVGAPVLAAAGGVVTFAGQVAGRGLVVIAHPDGISTEYEPLMPFVRRGDSVTAGERIGSLSAIRHRGCAAACLHWGARRDGLYMDPLGLLKPLGVVRLLPCPARSCP